MRIVVVSGIWPPDPGGPASHAPSLAAFLLERGHVVEAVTTAAAPPAPRDYPVHWVSRELRVGVRHARCVSVIRACAARADVVYATSMLRRAAAGCTLARRPLVVKLTADEVFERMRRAGRFSGTLDEFQSVQGLRVRALRLTRDAALRRARHVLCPSAYLRDVSLAWGVDPDSVSVLANPAPPVPELPDRAELRREFGVEGPLLGFAGRLVPAKGLGVALDAVASLPDVTLIVVGEGPERERLEQRSAELGLGGRVKFLGGTTRVGVLRLFRAADAAILSSAWENLPHTVLEALAVGTPVIATAVGGVPEIVHDGVNGLLVPPGDAGALADAVRRFLDDVSLREVLAIAAAPSVADHTEVDVFATIERTLERARRA